MKKIISGFSSTVLLIFGFAAAITSGQSSGQISSQASMQTLDNDTCKVSEKAGDGWNACKQYTYEKKDEFENDLKTELKKLDGQISKIHQNIKKGTSDAQAKGQSQWDDLKTERAKAEKKLNDVSKSTESAWTDIEKGVRSAVDDLTKSVKKAKDDYK